VPSVLDYTTHDLEDDAAGKEMAAASDALAAEDSDGLGDLFVDAAGEGVGMDDLLGDGGDPVGVAGRLDADGDPARDVIPPTNAPANDRGARPGRQ